MLGEVITEFDKSIVKYPSMTRSPGGASNDLVPNLQMPDNPTPLLDPFMAPKVKGNGG